MREISEAIIKCFKNGNKLFVCGNGGSATMSNHFAGEFVGRFEKERAPLPAISLCSDVASITAISNDYSFEQVFSRQLEALGKPGDILITLSSSGTSRNIIKAQEKAKELGMSVFLFPTNAVYTEILKKENKGYESSTTATTQEFHLNLVHQIAREVEEAMFP